MGGNGVGGRGKEAEVEGMGDRHGGAWQRDGNESEWELKRRCVSTF